jgi:predicted ATPase
MTARGAGLHNGPVATTSLIGRAADVPGVGALLADARMVTLTGAGGSGKTRLAQQVATDAAPLSPGGIWWVELASAADDAQVVDLVATTIGGPLQPPIEALDQLVHHAAAIGGALLVLDNAEHVIDATARLVQHLVARCPDLRVLVTSRGGASHSRRIPVACSLPRLSRKRR